MKKISNVKAIDNANLSVEDAINYSIAELEKAKKAVEKRQHIQAAISALEYSITALDKEEWKEDLKWINHKK